MSETFVAAELPRTAYFTHTLRRARTAAEQRRHRYVTLEHLLFALLDDPDALKLLEAVNADVPVIRSSISDTVNNRMAASTEPYAGAPAFSYKFDTLMGAASEEAIYTGRTEIDGAIALLCVSKEAESSASIFLLANGFDPVAGRRILGTPIKIEGPADRTATPIGGNEPGGGSMDDMLASVRSILDAEEGVKPQRRPIAQQGTRESFQRAPIAGRVEPRLGESIGAGPVTVARVTERNGKGFGSLPLPEPAHREDVAPSTKTAAKARRKPGAPRETRPRASRLLDSMPQKIKAGAGHTIEIKMTKQECFALFRGVNGKAASAAEESVVSRAVTLRLSAPAGGLTVQTFAPETQWIFDRPGFLDAEAFGRWAWTIEGETAGRYGIALNVSARNITGDGVAHDAALPEARIEIDVRTSFVRTLGRSIETFLVLAAGAGLATGALYALKVFHMLPNL